MGHYLKCPYCGNMKMGIMPANVGKTWGLVEFDKNSDQVSLEGVMHVEVYACAECHSVLLKSQELSEI